MPDDNAADDPSPDDTTPDTTPGTTPDTTPDDTTPDPTPDAGGPGDARRRSTFGPIVLGGLAAGALTAVASAKILVAADVDGLTGAVAVLDSGRLPLASAFSLVVLAAWGVLLVTRGRVRRAVILLGTAAAVGVVVVLGFGFATLPDAVAGQLGATGSTDTGTHFTAWYWLAWVGSLLSVGATLLAVVHAPRWPEMGRRYDAPGSGPVAEPESNLDLWRAMDEGRDPTA